MATRRKQPAACDVVVVGSYNQDMIWQASRLPAPGETRMGRFSSGPGGKGFNQAVAAARQGARTLFVAARGQDALGERAAEIAAAEGIEARWQIAAGEATGTAAIWLDATGQNQIVVAPGANHQALLAECEILTPNETEFAAALAARGVDVDVRALATLSDEDLHALCRQLPVLTVVLTLGAAGAFVSHLDPARFSDDHAGYRIPGEKAHVVDTTGAGDCFNGALAAGLATARQSALALHVRHANRCAACAVESPGAAPSMPLREDVARRYPG
jgi:ribokinase